LLGLCRKVLGRSNCICAVRRAKRFSGLVQCDGSVVDPPPRRVEAHERALQVRGNAGSKRMQPHRGVRDELMRFRIRILLRAHADGGGGAAVDTLDIPIVVHEENFGRRRRRGPMFGGGADPAVDGQRIHRWVRAVLLLIAGRSV
jgi:hypothetical protein